MVGLNLNKHQVLFALSNLHRPWVITEGIGAGKAAIAESRSLYGAMSHVDDAGDAFRHTYAAGRLKLAYMSRHGASEELADRLVTRLGNAHERDGWHNPLGQVSSAMDHHNNAAGMLVTGAGRTSDGAWMSNEQVRSGVLDAMRGGTLVRIQAGAIVPTGPRDLPSAIDALPALVR